MAVNKTKGLGRGLESIFEIEKVHLPEKNKKRSLMDEVELSKITPNPNQPRTLFDEDAQEEQAASIRTVGVIQPITVRKEENEAYFIISGERRFRAAQRAGLTTIPVYIREVDDQTLLEMALVENIQRQDLNAVDIALSLQRLMEECNLTQDSLAGRVGKKRSTVTNYLRLLKLPAPIQLAVREELITMGHARALVAVESEDQQIALLKKIVKGHLSVRQTEDLVQKLGETRKTKKNPDDEEYPEEYTRLVEKLESFFNPDISIRKNAKGGGKITIDFHSDDEIKRFLEKFDSIR
ncbi:MAG: ParB/RepB/Spo0J family partition protein [Rikenellaceae bacterium]|nr:ParB/RepB/Spo0J family partition protein [Rikenellaceae bacterium]